MTGCANRRSLGRDVGLCANFSHHEATPSIPKPTDVQVGIIHLSNPTYVTQQGHTAL